jgi:hypothetical protein
MRKTVRFVSITLIINKLLPGWAAHLHRDLFWLAAYKLNFYWHDESPLSLAKTNACQQHCLALTFLFFNVFVSHVAALAFRR